MTDITEQAMEEGKDLSAYSREYDIDGDGVLNEDEKASRAMDVNHEGHISNEKVYEMLLNQRKLHHQVFNMKRILIGLVVFCVILALSNLGTAFAAAILAKDTSIESGTIVDKNGNPVAIDSNVHTYSVGTASSGTNANERRVLQSTQEAGVSKIGVELAEDLHNNCGQVAYINRNFPNGGTHSLQVCPSSSFGKSGSDTAPIYTFSGLAGGSGELTITCPSATDSSMCDMTGNSLLLQAGFECTTHSDCASDLCLLSVCNTKNGNSIYYEWSATDNGGDGKSPSTPFNSIRKARKALKPGDTLHLMGEVRNDSYDPEYSFGDITDDHLWNSENSIQFSKINGAPGNYITIKPHDSNTTLRGDGANLFRLMQSSYVHIVGFDMEGEVDRIPLATAEALQFVYRDTDNTIKYRVPPGSTTAEIENMVFEKIPDVTRPSYTDTRGFYASDCHHIVIENNKIHHTPGNGLRVANSEYVDILNNEVHDCSRKSYSGTHGVVPTFTQDNIVNDPSGVYRMRVMGNKVYNNYNEIYSWAPTKTIITPHIDEGKGISLQRNQAFQNGGRILVANNIAYWNGFSGIHSNDGDNVDFVGNTAYMNSYTNTITYNKTPKGKAVGISFSGGTGNRLINNIAVVDTDVKGFPFSILAGDVEEAKNNLSFGIGALELKQDEDYASIASVSLFNVNPFFANADGNDFTLQAGSPAIQAGDASFAKIVIGDFNGDIRSKTAPTIGAFEFDADDE